MWSLCVRDSSNWKTSFFEPSVSFLPVLPSTKLGCTHFWKWLVFVSTWLSLETGKLLYRLGGLIDFGRVVWGGWLRIGHTNCLTGRIFALPDIWDGSNEAGPHPMSELLPHTLGNSSQLAWIGSCGSGLLWLHCSAAEQHPVFEWGRKLRGRMWSARISYLSVMTWGISAYLAFFLELWQEHRCS